MKQIKVLQIAQATGGVQKHILYLAKGLNKERFEVISACPAIDRVEGVDTTKTSFPQALRNAGVRVFVIDMHRNINLASDLISFLKIFSLIKKEKFDIVHTHSSKAGFLGRLSARLLGVPVILYTPNSFAFDKPTKMFFHKVLYICLERLAAHWCNMIIAVSESERNVALRYKIAPPHKITVISNTINLEEFDTVSAVDNIEKRESLGIDANAKVIITTARLTQQKSPLDFVKVAKYVTERRKDVKFFIAGDGPLVKKTGKFINKNKLENYVKLLGWRTDVKELIYISDIFILTSLWEGLPYTLMEAMALKKPIVATNVTGTRDLIKDGYNGYLLPPCKPDLLGRSVLKLLDDPDLSKEMGLRGHEILNKRINLKEHISATEDLYIRLFEQEIREK